MKDKVFVDTNILVYARDTSDPKKYKTANALLTKLWKYQTGRLSTQVLNEYYVTVTRKLTPGLSRNQAQDDIHSLLLWRPVDITCNTITEAWGLEARYSLSWWDSLIICTALIQNCKYLVSEDLQHMQQFDSLTVIDPFVDNRLI